MPAYLPSVMCIGRFNSSGQDVLTRTSLTIVWFQDTFAMPADSDVLEHIRSLAWDDVAGEYEV